MEKLTPVEYTLVRFATAEEREREWYLLRDGKKSILKIVYAKLSQNYTTTLEEIRDIYNRVVAKSELKDGERIESLKLDLTKYYQYNTDGTPKLASEEYPVSHDIGKVKKATYNPRTNRLIIWENGFPVYENCNGVICDDAVALADTYM